MTTQQVRSKIGGKPLRADAERTVRAILAGAERALSADPAATMEQIAEAVDSAVSDTAPPLVVLHRVTATYCA